MPDRHTVGIHSKDAGEVNLSLCKQGQLHYSDKKERKNFEAICNSRNHVTRISTRVAHGFCVPHHVANVTCTPALATRESSSASQSGVRLLRSGPPSNQLQVEVRLSRALHLSSCLVTCIVSLVVIMETSVLWATSLGAKCCQHVVVMRSRHEVAKSSKRGVQ